MRELEKRGIGRPSTYAEIISKVQARDYVEKLPGGQLKPTRPRQVRGRRPRLDQARLHGAELHREDGGGARRGRRRQARSAPSCSSRFYKRFREVLDVAKKQQRWTPEPEPTEHQVSSDVRLDAAQAVEQERLVPGLRDATRSASTRATSAADGERRPRCELPTTTCDKCGKPMVIKSGRYGEFLSCSGYPECKNARPVPLGVPCPKCGGDIIEIRSQEARRRAPSTAALNYAAQKCDFKALAEAGQRALPAAASARSWSSAAGQEPEARVPEARNAATRRPLEEGEELAGRRGERAERLAPEDAEPSSRSARAAAPKRRLEGPGGQVAAVLRRTAA